MNYAHAVPDHERLPWLSNGPKAAPSGETPLLLTWGLVAVAVVGGASYWMGMNSGEQPVMPERPSATIVLPEPAGTEPAADIAQPAMPEVEPVADSREVTPARQRKVRVRPRLGPISGDSALPTVIASQKDKAAAAKASEDDTEDTQELTYWPASVSEGARGRVVRIGTFKSRLQAKRAWWKVVKVYPGMKTLKAVVTPVTSERNGRTFYRLQFGTTSQAHSAVLCQRMLIVRVPCTVVGVPEPGGRA